MNYSEEKEIYRERGYTNDLLPKTPEQRTWKTFNYFTLWMGSVHNVPNYLMVGGFYSSLSTLNIMFAIALSAICIAFVMVMNGAAGSKYGIHSRCYWASYGIKGSLFPGVLRGCIAAIMWFGLQCFTGSLALLILIRKIWLNFL